MCVCVKAALENEKSSQSYSNHRMLLGPDRHRLAHATGASFVWVCLASSK